MGAQPYAIGKGSRRGPKREQNEDHVGVPPDWVEGAVLESKGRLVIVADGMGGHQAGQDASRRAVSRIFHEYYSDPSPDIPRSLEQAITLANAEVYQAAQQNPAFQGMGTTIVAAVLRGNELYVANVGDSRAYLVRGGTAHQLTKDHSFVQEQIDQGTITAEQARTHPYRNVITRSIGARPQVQVDHFQYQLQPGDRVVLCTDGVSGVVENAEIARAVASNPDPVKATEELLNLADRLGRTDDASVIVAGVPGRVAAPPGGPGALQTLGLIPLAAAGCVLVVVAFLAIRGFSTPTPQPTLTPIAATTVAPTVTIGGEGLPTATPVSVLTATPLPTATPKPTRIPTPIAVRAPQPILRLPTNGANVGGDSVRLEWEGTLRKDRNEWFDVRLWQDGQDPKGVIWTQDKYYDCRPPKYGKWNWAIAVMQLIGTNTDGSKYGPQVSDQSTEWWFTYSLPSTAPVDTPIPQPEPTRPPAPLPTTPPTTTLASMSVAPSVVGAAERTKPLDRPNGSARIPNPGLGTVVRFAAYRSIARTGSIKRQGQVNLLITKRAEPEEVLPGEMLTYTIHYENTGDAAANQVRIIDRLPTGITNTIVSSSTPISQTEFAGGVYTWTIGSLAPSPGGDITITAKVRDGVIAATPLENTAWITSSSAETNTVDNRSSFTVTVGRLAKVAISPGQARTVAPGAFVTYTHAITNVGNFTYTVDITLSESSPWGDRLGLLTAELSPEESFSTTVRIYVPEHPSEVTHLTMITVTCRSEPSVSASATDTTTVTTVTLPRLFLPNVIRRYCAPDPYEPNDSIASAWAVSPPCTIHGWFCPEAGGDQNDFFKLQVAQQGTYSLTLTMPDHSDYDLYLYNSGAQLICWSNRIGDGIEEQFDCPLEVRDYYIRVYAFSRGLDCMMPYSLSVQRKP
jgi:uncharacterized repeat protein (TIGR01451 family)